MCQEVFPAPVSRYVQLVYRRDKLNSQFIVTKFSILHVGGRLLIFILLDVYARLHNRVGHPPIRALELEEWEGFQDTVYLQHMKNVKKIDVSSDDKL